MSSAFNSTEYENLGTIIKRLRKKKGLTQAELADLVGVKPQTIGKYETGLIKFPPLDKLQAIKDIIDDDNYILEFLLHDVSDTSQDAVNYTENFAWALSIRSKIDPDFVVFLQRNNIDLRIGENSNFFGFDVQKLIIAWHDASEKDKKAVSFILGFDYEPKEEK